MRLSEQIARKRTMRIVVAGIFAFYAVGIAVVLYMFGGSERHLLPLQVLVGATAVVIFFAPTETMRVIWFQALSVIASLEAMTAMIILAPHSGAATTVFVFIGPLVAFMLASRVQIAAHLVFATVAMWIPVLVTDITAESVLMVLIAMPVMWGLGLCVMYVWATAEEQHALIAQLAQNDPLTGVANRRALVERVEYELTRHERTGRELTVVVLDLDGFKGVNDTLGHGAGDELLCDVAEALTRAVRDQDTVARQGGDEFCVLAPETGPAEAADLVARIKGAIAGVEAAGRALSAGVGFACYPVDALGSDTLFEVADERQRIDKPVALGRREIPAPPIAESVTADA